MSAAANLEGAFALEARHYLGEASLQGDLRQVLARSWQLVAHSAQLASEGDHVVEQVGAVPVLMVRGQDGVLRAFANVCRHRAGPLAWCNGQGARALHCKYHGWSYGLDGGLRSAPEMEGAVDFDKSSIRLPEFRVREWQGLVFVAIDAATPDFDEVYAGIAERIAPMDLSSLRFHRRDRYEVACNWKVYVDNYLEGYHLPHVHPGLSKLLDYRNYRTELAHWHSLQHSPLRNNGDLYGDGEAFYYFVYPNVMLNILPGRLQTNRVLPLGAERCAVEFDYYYAPDDETQKRIGLEQDFSDEIQQEDIGICEAVQRGLASGTYKAGRLCPKRENGVWHFHQRLREAYASGETQVSDIDVG